jgi:ribosome-binding factor A
MLGQQLTMRSVPQLHFHIDRTLQQGAHISALIDKAVQSDRHNNDDE